MLNSQELKNNYFDNWRKDNPNYWHLIQMTWYYKSKKVFLLGQKKLSNEEYETYTKYEDEKIKREILREVIRIDRMDKKWRLSA